MKPSMVLFGSAILVLGLVAMVNSQADPFPGYPAWKPFAEDTVVRIGHPAAFGLVPGRGLSANYVLSLSLNITHTMWAENVNARGGIPVQGKSYLVELVVVDVGHRSGTTEGQLNVNVTKDMIAGRYGRIDFLFPAYSGARTIESLQLTDAAELPLVSSTGDGGAFRCQAPLPSDCRKVGDIRFPKFGGVCVQTPGQYYFNGFIGMIKLRGARSLVMLTENVSFTLGVNQGAAVQASQLKIDVKDNIIIARHQVNTLTTPEANYTAAQQTQMQQLKDAVKKIKELNPDAVVVGSYQDLCRNLMNELAAQDYMPKSVAFVQCLGQQLVDEYASTGSRGSFIMGASGFAPGLRGAEYTEDANDPMFHFPPSDNLPSSDVFSNAFVNHWLFKQSGLPVQPSLDGRSWVLPTYQLGASYVMGYVVYQSLVRSNSFDKTAWRAEMARVQFNSFYGPVAFDNAGLNYAKTFITQQLYPDGYFYTVAPLDNANANMVYPAPTWKDRLANFELKSADSVFIALAVVGGSFCLGLMILFIIWRDRPQIVASSLIFCLIILLGSILSFASMGLWTTKVASWSCNLQRWLLALGLDLFLIPLLVKNLRVLLLFKQVKNFKVKIIPNWVLLVGVGAGLLPDLLVLLVWSIGYPQRAVLVQPVDFWASLDFYFCTSSGITKSTTIPTTTADVAFVATLGAIKGAIILAGIIVTFLLRKVPSEFNESKYIGYAIYNFALCLLLLLIIWLALPLEQFLFSTIAHEVILLWALFISVAFIFIPKVYFVLTNRKADFQGSSSLSGTQNHQTSEAQIETRGGPTENEKELQYEIEALKAELAKLRAAKEDEKVEASD